MVPPSGPPGWGWSWLRPVGGTHPVHCTAAHWWYYKSAISGPEILKNYCLLSIYFQAGSCLSRTIHPCSVTMVISSNRNLPVTSCGSSNDWTPGRNTRHQTKSCWQSIQRCNLFLTEKELCLKKSQSRWRALSYSWLSKAAPQPVNSPPCAPLGEWPGAGGCYVS